MSEKHLTELPWKVLVTKQGVKDIGLGKALVAYANLDATKEPAKALARLDEIAELAVKLKKANPTKAEVVAHLDDVIKEVKKNTPGLQDKVKSAASTPVAPANPAAAAKAPVATKPALEDADEEKEAAEFKRDLKRQMLSALAHVKARAPGDPNPQKQPEPQLQFMTYLAGKACAVIVARRVGTATKGLLPDIAGGASGGQYLQGECIFEKNAHTFVLAKVPGGLARKIATALQAETGQKYIVRVRSTGGSVTLDADTDIDPDAALVSPTSPAPAAGGDEMAKFTARFKLLQPDLVKAIATRTPQGDQAKKQAVEAGALAAKKDFAQANRILDAVDALLKQGLATATTTGDAKFSLVQLQKNRLAWDSLRKSVQAQLRELEKAIRGGVSAHNQDEAAEDEFEEGEVENAIKTLYTLMDKFDERLIDKLDEALNAQNDEQRRGRHQEAAGIIQEYQAFAAGDPILSAIDEHGFTKSTIRSAVTNTLAELAAKF